MKLIESLALNESLDFGVRLITQNILKGPFDVSKEDAIGDLAMFDTFFDA